MLAARKLHLKVRAAGATHSWSNLFPDPGDILLDMSGFKTLENGERAQVETVPEHSRVFGAGERGRNNDFCGNWLVWVTTKLDR